MLFTSAIALVALATTTTQAVPVDYKPEDFEVPGLIPITGGGNCCFHIKEWAYRNSMRLDATYFHYLDIQAKDQSGKVVWKTTKEFGGGVYSGDEEAYVVKGVYPRDLMMRAEDRGGMYIAFGYGSNGWASSDPFNRQASCKVGKWNKSELKYQTRDMDCCFQCQGW